VLEIGTNHFGEVKYLADIAQPNIGVITNIGESHLESFKNLKGVFREKYNLVRSLRNPAIAVLNADDSFMKRQVYKGSEKPLFIGVGIKNKAEFCASRIRFSQGMPRFKVNQRFGFALNALGYYNIYNSLLAIAIGRIFGLEYKDIRKSLSSFNLPRGRLNFKYINKVEFIDDTYNANPLSLRQALKVLADLKTRKRKILVLGDMLELGEKAKDLHEQAIKDGLNSCDLLLAVGRMMSDCALKFVKKTDKLISCENSAQAAKILFEDICAGPEDIVLVKGSRGMNMEEVFNI
jgi:UDP-N-acetylmuramyl pentapeptide synthase